MTVATSVAASAMITLALTGCAATQPQTDAVPHRASVAAQFSFENAKLAPQQTATGTSWSDYMFPQRVGTACSMRSTIKIAKVGTVVTTGVTTVSKVRPVSTGKELTLRQKVATVTYLVDGGTDRVAPKTSTLKYVIRNDGTLGLASNPIQSLNGDGLTTKVTGGEQLFPDISALRSGASRRSSVTVAMNAASKADTSITSETTDGGPLRIRADFVSKGVPTAAVTVGKRTYRDVVAVRVTFKMSVLNASGDLEGIVRDLAGTGGSYTTWFARGLGPVDSKGKSGTFLDAVTKNAKNEFLGCS